MEDFKEITVCRDWCCCDQLDGEELKDGERLDLLWPDGSIIIGASVKLREFSETCMEHGGIAEIPYKMAYYKTMHRGARVMVELRESSVKARRSLCS
jgi:hypothetical protein